MNITLTPAQDHVLAQLVAFKNVATLSGYAGVGKTTTVAAFIERVAERMRACIAAPTHKAVAVLQSKLLGAPSSVEFMTIHQALGLKLKPMPDGSSLLVEDGSGHCDTVADFDLLVVDEASMVSTDMYARIMSARRSCRVLFVGDPAQLAPVDDQSPSPVFDPSLVPHQFRLTEILRQAQDNPIIRWSQNIRLCIDQNVRLRLEWLANELQPHDAQHLMVVGGGDECITKMMLSAHQTGLNAAVLCFDNRSVNRHNQNIHDAIYRLHADVEVPPFMPGQTLIAQERFSRPLPDRITIQNNDALTVVRVLSNPRVDEWGLLAYELLLRHHDREVALWVSPEQEAIDRVVNNLFGEHRIYKNSDPVRASAASKKAWNLKRLYPNLRYAYAMTIHKSQGSTIDTAIIDWRSAAASRDAAQLNRLMYVAVTRPTQHVVVVTE